LVENVGRVLLGLPLAASTSGSPVLCSSAKKSADYRLKLVSESMPLAKLSMGRMPRIELGANSMLRHATAAEKAGKRC
jgi:hypothetical protein